ncbi:hypothetical protein [Chryseobacterium aquifrigidense]|uniref:Uncharacterized protein n=1 Tax=Chryseobacterium aquifrigidense TaxID=558021 RepID=A0A543EA34_9FLAO|nr:hypothetical protein [Chryseobacterium aquifrigidense]TQM18339.1 hypothetical protein FB551_4120 [Chryseobacterium aquifrigidense]
MIPINHIINENSVKNIFKFIVPSGSFQGEYVINKPDGWDDVDSIVNIDDELLFVKDFIIGENTKLKFYQYSNKIAYDVLFNVNQEQSGDGRVIFKWLAIKEGVEYDLLKDNFEVNMNKYKNTLENNTFVIDVELIKSEAQNKLFNRDDVTIDLFGTKDIDENVITPVETFPIGYKKGDKKLSNFYSYDISQLQNVVVQSNDHFLSFSRSDEYGFGDNTNDFCGVKYTVFYAIDQGPFVSTNISLKKLQVEISNLHVKFTKSGGGAPYVKLQAYINGAGENKKIDLQANGELIDSVEKTEGGVTYSEIKIDNVQFGLPSPNENLRSGQSLSFYFHSDDFFVFESVKTNTSIELTTNMESPLVRTTGIRIIDAIKQVVKNYTSSGLSVLSNYLGFGGTYYDTSISTGVFLRGLPETYTVGQKIKTSFKSMVTEGAAKLLSLGYDVLNSNVIIEDTAYFFKDVKVYDLSNKLYLQEGYSVENDKDVVFNTMIFGSKKYSKNVKDDIQNFITSAEFTTPIITTKNKFDKQTDLIVDEYKIQELIEDKSSSTNDNDDDLVLVDLAYQNNYWDSGIFENCIHSNKGGNLSLVCTVTPFDTTLMQVGAEVQITEGINSGTWTILSINKFELILNKTSGIEEGSSDTPITYYISSLIKNRSIRDGFTEDQFVRNPETSTNSRHNPKYHMARWFQWFGSGLRKKQSSELLKVTNYKNNDKAQMKINSTDLVNELPGLITVGADENLGRLRAYKQPFFSGEKIEISYTDVTFKEFIALYENWRYGISGNRLESRGYVTLNTPLGIYDAYPFGDGAFSHDRKTNVLSFKGKIKGKSVSNPTLVSVVQENKNTVTLHWDYVSEYISPTVDAQYSIDGVNWITLHQFFNVKQGTIIDDIFTNIITGTNVYFRVIANTNDFVNKISNTLTVDWDYNPYTIIVNNKAENADCGYSRLVLDIKGKANFNVEYTYQFLPGGGKLYVTNLDGTGGNVIIETGYGLPVSGTDSTTLNIDGTTARLFMELLNSDKAEGLQPLNCTVGDTEYTVYAYLSVKFTDTITNTFKIFDLQTITTKKYLEFTPPVE